MSVHTFPVSGLVLVFVGKLRNRAVLGSHTWQPYDTTGTISVSNSLNSIDFLMWRVSMYVN